MAGRSNGIVVSEEGARQCFHQRPRSFSSAPHLTSHLQSSLSHYCCHFNATPARRGRLSSAEHDAQKAHQQIPGPLTQWPSTQLRLTLAENRSQSTYEISRRPLRMPVSCRKGSLDVFFSYGKISHASRVLEYMFMKIVCTCVFPRVRQYHLSLLRT